MVESEKLLTLRGWEECIKSFRKTTHYVSALSEHQPTISQLLRTGHYTQNTRTVHARAFFNARATDTAEIPIIQLNAT